MGEVVTNIGLCGGNSRAEVGVFQLDKFEEVFGGLRRAPWYPSRIQLFSRFNITRSKFNTPCRVA